ncbi:MAG: hypothetical protein LW817_01915, partial [Candidatus Caenarcaniphilales bacterium]|nr:hypothetical protein [Candidatus Caenarcaniphilales bacterium]
MPQSSKRKKLQTRKQDFIQGYRLHRERIKKLADGKSSSVRSIKFPLVTKNKDIFNEFFEAIKHDYKYIVGDMNFADWKANDIETSSLLLLWKTAIQSGVVIARANDVASKFYSILNAPCEVANSQDSFAEFNNDTSLKLSISGLEKSLFVGQRKGMTFEGLIVLFYQSCENYIQLDKKQQSLVKSLSDIPEEIRLSLQSVIKPVWDTNSLKLPPEKVFNQTKKDLITKYNLDMNKPNSIGRTFFSIPSLKTNSLEESLDLFALQLTNLNHRTGYDEKDILGGLESNFEGLSSFFGSIDPQKSLSNDLPIAVTNIVNALIENPSRLVKPADYRSQVGGMLSSYVTNHFKRRSELQDDLEDSKSSKINLKANLQKLEDFLEKESNQNSIDLKTFDKEACVKSISELKQWF